MKPGHALLFVVTIAATLTAQDVRIGVLGLFHPHELIVSSVVGTAAVLHIEGQNLTLDTSVGMSRASIRMQNTGLLVRCGSKAFLANTVILTSRDNGVADFILSVPGKIARNYQGRMEVSNNSSELVPVVTMELENAVASVVHAETLPGEPIEALKAQAVAVRSYLIAGKGRHEGFDFCDTTHCQFLRSPPSPQSEANRAAKATHGLVLAFDSHVFAAMYTRSCNGRTRTPADVGLPPGAYPYYSVECHYCRQHSALWHSRISAHDAADLISSNEPSRLKVARTLGWNTVPSNNFTMRKQDGQVLLDGVGQGHGIGLCQAGAKAMAERGANFHEILTHYYPNTGLVTLSR